MADGTVYAGVSPDTGEAMYAMPHDARLTYSFNQARKYAAKLDEHGHHDWRVPTKGELNRLFQHRAAIGGFSKSEWYGSSSQDIYIDRWDQRFSDGYQFNNLKYYAQSLRCVR
jgi:hypothetical protein